MRRSQLTDLGLSPIYNAMGGMGRFCREVCRKACREVERRLILEVCREAETGNLDEAEKEKCSPQMRKWVVTLRSAVPIRWKEN